MSGTTMIVIENEIKR